MIVFRNSAPVAPSTARWSHVSVIVIIGRTCRSPSRGTTWSRVAPTARIDACGGLSTAMNWSMSYMPRFEIVNVPPSRSSAAQLAVARAADEIGAHLRDLRDRQPLRAAHDRDDEPLRRGDRDADVGAREDEQRVVRELDVHVAVAHQRLRATPS